MRRVLVLTAVGLVMASLMASSQAAVRSRTDTESYTISRGRIHIQSADNEFSWYLGTQPETFRALTGENWVTLSLEDDSGNPVRGRAEIADSVFEFCSDTQDPIAVEPGQKVKVMAILGECGGTQSVVTEGTITATFTK